MALQFPKKKEGIMIIDCPACDPNFYVVYGYCPSCKRMCEPPLIDYHEIGPLDAQEMRDDWIKERDTGIKTNRGIYL